MGISLNCKKITTDIAFEISTVIGKPRMPNEFVRKRLVTNNIMIYEEEISCFSIWSFDGSDSV